MRAQIEASDKGTILVNRVPGADPFGTHFVSITGIVSKDLSINENAFENLGNDFSTFNAFIECLWERDLDAANFNRLVEFMPKSPALFVS